MPTATQRTVVVWQPQPGPQTDLIECPLDEVFFGGSRGGGKTDGVLGKWALKDQRYGDKFNATMFRRTTVSAEDAIERSKEIYGPLGGEFNQSNLRWRMPNGGRVSFRYLENVQDADHQQGRNLTDAWVEEVGQYPHPAPIDRLNGVLRSAHGIPTQLLLTGNPGGAGQHWIAQRYKLIPFGRSPYVVARKLPNGELHEAAVIPSRITDNRVLLDSDPGYINRLHLVGNDQLVKAWLEGDWSAIEGAFFDTWSEARHVIEPRALPDHWTRFRSMDWGYAAPFSVGWWAVVGEDYDIGKGWPAPRGALIRYREWYGAKAPGEGLRMDAEQVALGILDREDGEQIDAGVLDPAAWATDSGPSPAERLITNGVMFRKADNRRVAKMGAIGGWDQMRARLRGNEDGEPLVYCFSTCRDSIRTIPVLQHDPMKAEDVQTLSEDHCFVADTLVDTDQGPRRIADLDSAGYVHSIGGLARYRNARLTRKNAPTVKLTFGDTRPIICTPDHRFLTPDGWVEAKDMEGREICRSWSAIQSRSSEALGITVAVRTFRETVSAFTASSGKRQMVPCLTAFMFTMLTMIGRTIASKTSSLWRRARISAITALDNRLELAKWLVLGLPSGMAPKLADAGTASITRSAFAMSGSAEKAAHASSVGNLMKAWPSRVAKLGFARMPAKAHGAGNPASTMKFGLVRSAGRNSQSTNIPNVAPARGNVEPRQAGPRVESVKPSGNADVYCLTVPSTAAFSIEGGLIVLNCADEWRYACMARPVTNSRKQPKLPGLGHLATIEQLVEQERRRNMEDGTRYL